jgi:Mrp family chromosome partitioning ATPase
VNGRGRVEVPENAVRSEPIAFGLSAVQLLVCGAGVAIGALINLLPLWVPAKVALLAVVVGPVVLAAVLPIGGEPAYRWLVRAARYARGERVWQARLEGVEARTSAGEAADKPEVSGGEHDAAPDAAEDTIRRVGDNAPTTAQGGSPARGEAAPDAAPPPPARDGGQKPMSEPRLLRPHAVRLELDNSDGPDDAPTAGRVESRAPIPHLLPGLRIACLVSFAGGVGKTTLAVEVATHVAAHARYLTIDGEERALRVLLLDASRVTAGAAGIRLGLDGGALLRASSPVGWRHPRAVEGLAVATRSGVDVAIAPAHPTTLGPELQPEPERDLFGADDVDDLVEGARADGYQLLVVDLGSHLEDGHRHLLDRADLVLGVVRPTLESLPDVHRLATVLRTMGAGRKLALVASQADDDGPVRSHAHDAGVPLAGAVPSHPAFTAACERGEPAWSIEPALVPAIRGVASAVWPLLADEGARPRGLRGPARRLAGLRRGSAR